MLGRYIKYSSTRLKINLKNLLYPLIETELEDIELRCRSKPCIVNLHRNFANGEERNDLESATSLSISNKVNRKRVMKAFNYAIEHYSPGKTPW